MIGIKTETERKKVLINWCFLATYGQIVTPARRYAYLVDRLLFDVLTIAFVVYSTEVYPKEL